MRAEIDDPIAGAAIDPLSALVRGWVWLDAAHPSVAAVEIWSGDRLVGETRSLFARPDVVAALHLPPSTRNGFELFLHDPDAAFGREMALAVRVRLANGDRTEVLAKRTAQAISRDYRTADYGVLLDQNTRAIQREANIFATGPSIAGGSGEVAALLRRYFGPPPKHIVDVGCGLGWYGQGLLADGYDWIGAELDPADCAELTRHGLPHRQVDGRSLPFADGEFDAAMCIEVLEHIEEPRAFLREIQRVAPRQLLVSVPNCELLSYLSPHLVIPWHMLESTHVNYFTRWSLGALLREFYPVVELRYFSEFPLRTPEGTALHYNLFAAASAP